MTTMTFDEWAKTKSDDLYEEIEFLFSEGAMTADDIYMQIEAAFKAGYEEGVYMTREDGPEL